jgi:hypothetical protein
LAVLVPALSPVLAVVSVTMIMMIVMLLVIIMVVVVVVIVVVAFVALVLLFGFSIMTQRGPRARAVNNLPAPRFRVGRFPCG